MHNKAVHNKHTERDMTRAPAGGIKASGILNILPPRPPSFFHLEPPNLWFKRSAMSLASSMCCRWSSPDHTILLKPEEAVFLFLQTL